MHLNIKLEDIKRTLSLCIKCSMCTYGDWPENRPLCHMFSENKFFTYSGGGGVYLARSLVQGLIEPTPGIGDVVFRCHTCGNCQRICEVLRVPPPHLSPEDVIKLLRAHLFKAGVRPPEGLEKAGTNVLSKGNPYGFQGNKRYGRRDIPSQGKVILHLGCVPAFQDQVLVDSILKIFKRVGQEVAFIEGESCCGKPLFDAGIWDGLPKIATDNMKRIAKTGAQTVVFLCPHCYEIYAHQYPDWITEKILEIPKYVHISGFLSQIDGIEDLFKASRRSKVVTFQDPCYLSRIMGESDKPRKILESIPEIKLVELKGNRSDAPCCGAGGGVDISFPELAARRASIRIEEALSIGADTLATACPHCKALFNQNKATGAGGLRIMDITELMVENLF